VGVHSAENTHHEKSAIVDLILQEVTIASNAAHPAHWWELRRGGARPSDAVVW